MVVTYFCVVMQDRARENLHMAVVIDMGMGKPQVSHRFWSQVRSRYRISHPWKTCTPEAYPSLYVVPVYYLTYIIHTSPVLPHPT